MLPLYSLGASIGHFFGVHDDPTTRGHRRTGTFRQVNYSPVPYVEGGTQDPPPPPPPQRQQSLITSTLNRMRRIREPTRDEVMGSLPKFWPVTTILIALLEIGLLIAVIVLFGLAPIAFVPTTVSDTIVGFNNLSEYQTREIVPNFFIGPSSSSLVHSGAMYTPVSFLIFVRNVCMIWQFLNSLSMISFESQCIRDNRDFQLLVARTSYEESKLRCCKSSGLEQCGMLPQDM